MGQRRKKKIPRSKQIMYATYDVEGIGRYERPLYFIGTFGGSELIFWYRRKQIKKSLDKKYPGYDHQVFFNFPNKRANKPDFITV